MATVPALPTPHDLPTYLEDGARIAGILLLWGILGTFVRFGLTEFGLFERTLWQLGDLLLLTGALNAVLFVLYRVVDYHNRYH
ncbi:hypothetical protein [Halovivax limisalsi]|uniref:hypothetical protein n=1 Tax=Halovivax limisalsi TaxID=1453760 RepID=UPI001FFCF2E1|nr:hypothetical protein [Halovivax limisalsi]